MNSAYVIRRKSDGAFLIQFNPEKNNKVHFCDRPRQAWFESYASADDYIWRELRPRRKELTTFNEKLSVDVADLEVIEIEWRVKGESTNDR